MTNITTTMIQHDTTNAPGADYDRTSESILQTLWAIQESERQAFALVFGTIETTQARKDAIKAHKATQEAKDAVMRAIQAIGDARANAVERGSNEYARQA